MRTAVRAWVAVALYAAATATIADLVATTSCSSKLVVEPAKECANPCCDGPASGIDCSENPNLTCVEDADPCTARTYGCSGGTLFVMAPTQVPTSCSVDGSAGDVSVGFVLGGPDGLASDGPDAEAALPDAGEAAAAEAAEAAAAEAAEAAAAEAGDASPADAASDDVDSEAGVSPGTGLGD